MPDFSLSDGARQYAPAAFLIFSVKASPCSNSVIVSAGVDGKTQKIQFVCDENPHPPETKGAVR